MKTRAAQKVCSILWLLLLGITLSLSVSGPVQAEEGCPSGMMSYWRLDETSGTVFGDSVSGLSAACATACPVFSDGRIKGALNFNGSTQGLTVPADASFNWGSINSFSIEFWMKPGSAATCSTTRVIVGRRQTDTIHWWVGCEGGVAAFYLYDGAGEGAGIYGTKALTDTSWHHIVAVRDAASNEIRIYVDGVKEGTNSVTYTGGFDYAANPLTIGWLSLASGYYFSGGIDEVALYSKELSENEIRQHYYDGAVGLRWGYCGCAQPVKIMPLGDSITHGIFGDPPVETRTDDQIGGYRLPLHTSLVNAGNYVDFVGSLSSGSSILAFDPQHEGHDGYCAKNINGLCPWGEIVSNVQGYLSANPADVILLHIGTNDISYGVPNIVSNVSEILDNIDLYSPDTVVVLSRIINRTDVPAMITATTQFNNNLAAMAAARIANGDRLIVVDHEHALNYATDMISTLHPNDSGYGKMAGVWQNALKDFLPVCGPVAPLIQSGPVTEATAGKPYTYSVSATGNPAPTFSLSTKPSGMTINAGTGLIQWTPATAGSFSVVVQASNSEGTDIQSFTIQVSEAPPCTTGMIHYWKLDELTGPTYKDFYWINDATCSNCPVATEGVVNGAQQFNGTTNMVSVPTDVSFNWGSTASFSIEFWMKPESADTCQDTRVIVGRNDSTKTHWWVGCEGGVAAFYLLDNTHTGGGVYGTKALTDAAWHHIVAVRDAGTNEIRIYVDGAQDGALSISYAHGFDALFAELNIGWLNLAGGYHFPGAIDEIALYDRALTATEIFQHNHYGVGTTPKGYCDAAAPAIISAPITVGRVGQLYTYDVEAMGNPAPTYSLTTKPTGMAINATTGLIQWTPTADGSFDVTVRASNGVGSPASQSFTVVVGAAVPSCVYGPVWLGGMNYQTSIQTAYESLSQGATVMITAGTMTESLDLSNNSFVVTLSGGYDCGFNNHGGYTTVKGTVTISTGTIIVDAITIE